MQYFIQHEGQSIPVPADIAADENKLRRALSSIIPGIAEAKISATEKDGVTTISIAKTAGTKGNNANILGRLVTCQGGVNPVIVCFEELQAFDMGTASAEEIVRMDRRIDAAAEKGKQQVQAIKKAYTRLVDADSQPAPVVILGF